MTILIFIVVLVVLILVHELGHFIVAKRCGIRVDEFGIGFPPKITGKTFGETEYTLNWLPIGGFVKIWGEDPTEDYSALGDEGSRSFVQKPRYVQAAVLVAGVLMNVLLAFVLFSTAFMMGTPTLVDEDAVTAQDPAPRLVVTSVMPGSPAAEVLKPNDEIIGVERAGEQLASDRYVRPSAVSSFIAASNGQRVTLTIVRRGEQLTASVVPVEGLIPSEPTRPLAGFTMGLASIQRLSPFVAIQQAGISTYEGLVMIVVGLGTLVHDLVLGHADLSSIAGPVGIVEYVGDAASFGFASLLTFTALISLNLAVINLLPIPALDGGRLLFVIVEAVTRRPIKPAFATRANQIGFVFLLALMALVTFHDVLTRLHG
jgi:regulator of sigma E protease